MYILYPSFKVDTSIQFRGVLMSRLKWNRTSVGTQSTCAEGSTISATTLPMKLYIMYYTQLLRCMYSQCMACAHLDDHWTDRQHKFITVRRHHT